MQIIVHPSLFEAAKFWLEPWKPGELAAMRRKMRLMAASIGPAPDGYRHARHCHRRRWTR